ncbi:MAG: hypothetical protein FD135_5095, partial [Comamonadaceae bacterium]
DNFANMNTSVPVNKLAKVDSGGFGVWLAQVLAIFRASQGLSFRVVVL